jgi:hypothetical protein
MSPLVQGLILLTTTAILSGLVAPYIVNRIQVTNQRRLKVYEADLARQSKIIEQQEAFIQRLSSLLWEFQLNLIAPIYYGQPGLQPIQQPTNAQDESSSGDTQSKASSYDDAVKNYLANAGRLIGSIRAEIGVALRLLPADQWNILRELYYNTILRLDLEATKLILEGPTKKNSWKWSQVHKEILSDFAKTLDNTIDGLAAALDLKYRTPSVRSD